MSIAFEWMTPVENPFRIHPSHAAFPIILSVHPNTINERGLDYTSTKFVQPATDNFFHVVHLLQTVKSNILFSQNAANSLEIVNSLESQHFPWNMPSSPSWAVGTRLRPYILFNLQFNGKIPPHEIHSLIKLVDESKRKVY